MAWPERGQQPLHALAGEGADLQHGGVGQEGEPVGHVDGGGGPPLGVEQLPLVEHDDDRAAGGVDALGQALVLMGDALGGVDDEQRGVGPVDGLEGPHQRVVLGALVDLRPCGASPPCRRSGWAPRRVDDGVDRVAGGARQVVDDGAVVADEPVEQRRLADVGTAHDGDTGDVVLVAASVPAALGLDFGRLGQQRDDGVEEVARLAAVKGVDRDGIAEAELREFPGADSSPVDSSTLLPRRSPGRAPGRSRLATRSSSSVTPTVASTTRSTTSASPWARSAWRHLGVA